MKYKGSIKKRLIYIIMLVTLLTSLAGYGSFVYWYMGNQYERSMNLAKTVGLVLGQDIAKLVLLNNISAAADISSKLKSFSSLDSMVLYKLDNTPIFQYSKENKSFDVDPLPSKENRIPLIKKNDLRLYINANYNDTHLGYVQLNFNVDTIFDLLKKDIDRLLFILIFMFFVSYLLALFFAKRFTEPILSLVNFLEKIDLVKSMKKRTSTKEDNEFGRLYDEVNRMLERIEKSHEALKIAAVAFETQSGMTITDKEQRILQVNKAFSDITGYTPSEVIGKTPAVLKSGIHDKKFYLNMYNSLKENHFWIGEITNRRKDGSLMNESLIIQAVLDDNKEIIYYVASFLDITKQKVIEKELSKKEELLIQQSKLAQMGEMLENIAHQWRQPLSLITTSASGIKIQKEMEILNDSFLFEGLDNIIESAEHLSQTVDDFRSFYKNDKSVRVFALKGSIDKAIALTASSFKNKDIELDVIIDDIFVTGYENELIQVFINILNNAADELVKRDNRKTIIISSQKVKDKMVVDFQDSAGGIPDDILPRIFESKFTTKGDTTGTGIGLYMSKVIMEKMSGDIKGINREFEYNDESLKGALFSVSFPIEQKEV